MTDEKISLDPEIELDPKIEEPVYITPPHPEASVVSNERAVTSEAPRAADKSMSDLIKQAVDELRDELRDELETQVNEFRADLQEELETGLKKSKEGGLELNGKG